MQAFLKIGLVCAILFSLNVLFMNEEESNAFQDIPLLRHVVSFTRNFRVSFLVEAKQENAPNKQSHATNVNTAESANKEDHSEQKDSEDMIVKQGKSTEVINLAVVACLDRAKETLVMLKSALLQTEAPLHFHIFADETNMPKFENELPTWRAVQEGSATFTVHPIQVPGEKWKTLFKPCATQRLFLPEILDKTESLLYVDTDVLFLRPLDDIWAFFKEFNSTQLAGLAPEHEPKGSGAGWYNRFARIPYYGELGVNSGVMLMNLARMREVNWINDIKKYYTKYNNRLTFGDQDLINIFFHYYPERLYVFPCDWNYRPDHCMYGPTCDSADENGASIIHGSRETFHNDKEPAFKAVYNAVSQLTDDAKLSSLLQSMEEKLTDSTVTKTDCGRASGALVKQLKSQASRQKSSQSEDSTLAESKSKPKKKRYRIHLAVVSCLDRVQETFVMLKSALLQTKAKLKFHIFADDDNRPKFQAELSSWPAFHNGKASYRIYPIQLPKENEQKWRTLWRPCASQRLFLPKILTNEDALLYVDTDVLFLRPLDDIWKFFSQFNSTQIAAVSPEHEEGYRGGWYNRFARHPYYGNMGVNSGVMLMNLTRMRNEDWVNKMVGYYDVYKYNITWGDQCLINIFFHFMPEGLFIFPCEWNTRPDHCMYGMHCQSSNTNGASIIHGNREVFHNEKQPAFKALYDAFKNHPFDGPLEDLLTGIEGNMSNSTILDMQCGRVSHIFSKQIEKRVKALRKQKLKKKTEL